MGKWEFRILIKILIVVTIVIVPIFVMETDSIIPLIIDLIIIIVVCLAYFFSNISNIRKQMVRDSYYCDLDFKYTPAMASYILDDQIEGPETLFGTALDLHTRKYLEIEKKDTKIVFRVTKKDKENLYEHEKYFLNAVNKDLELGEFTSCVIRDCIREKLISKNNKRIVNLLRYKLQALGSKLLWFLGFVLLVKFDFIPEKIIRDIIYFSIVCTGVGLALIVLGEILKFLIPEYKKENRGKMFFLKARGLKNYIRDYTLLEEKDFDYNTLVDRYLGYAVALGECEKIEKVYIEKFKITYGDFNYYLNKEKK